MEINGHKNCKIEIEKDLVRIEQIANEMESGELNLDKSIALFKEGAMLNKRCQDYLEATELEIKKVVDGELKDFE